MLICFHLILVETYFKKELFLIESVLIFKIYKNLNSRNKTFRKIGVKRFY